MVFIKKILIQGFKSYKELLDLESFSPRHNVIVGRNGSGKSNFFFAIRFVLSDLFTNLRADERQALLHEGAGVNVMSAFVEIHFDNSDRRFPIDREEVVLRRQIGLKKDEYSLDKKHVTKHDVVNLLEAAGFSRSNPYYIVQQGKVNALTMMKDAERLELLKEVAGTRVYDERREESLKIIKETSGRREKIEEVLAYIEVRLHELEEEQAELKAYQELDREHRAIKYTIYEKELEDATQGLAKLESSRNEESSKAKEEYQHVLRAHRKIKESERDIKELEVELRRLQKEKEEIEEERQDSIKARAKLELYVEEASRKVESDQKAQALLSAEAGTLNAEIENTKARLEELQPLFKEALDSERALSERLMDCERRTNELYSKQGRSARFNNKKERDSWIRKEIKQIDRNIEAQRQQIDVLQKELDQMQKRREDGAASIQQTQRKLEDIRRLVEKNNKSYNERKLERDELSNRRKELWRQDTDNDAAIQTLKTELIKVERQLQSTVNKITAIGLSAVTRLATEHGIRGVYGPLIELFDCPEEFMTAVEVTAGGSLFHVVVDSDRVASQLIDLLNEEGIAGRVTFMPLNRLNPEVPSALVESEDARPLIDQITFNPMFRSAFLQVFGKTLICLNIEVATGLAQTRNLNCVTVDGDQVNRKGALTGGFYDVRHSRLEAMKSIKAYKAKLKDLVAAAEKIKASAQETDQAVSNVLGQMQQLEVRGAKNRDTYEQLSLDLRLLMKDEEALRSTIEQKEQSVAELTMSLRQLEEARRSLEAELGTELLAQLRPQEQTELRQLNEEIQQKKNDLLVSAAQRAELETKKNALQNLLSANLLKRQAEINEEIGSLALVEAKVQLQQRQHDLGLVQTSVQETSQRLKEIDRQIDEKNTRVRDLRTAIDDLKATENKYTQQMQAESKTMEKLLNKRSLLLQKSEECMNKIRELGSRPSSVENYRGIERKELLRALDETSRKLQNYSKVNKKAGDQYVSFTQQHSELLRKKKEADEAAQKIEELIQVLDARKDAAIERTFKGVARHFQEVFSELVPAGSGLLVMQKGKDGQQARTGDEGEQAAGRISQYTGVAIKVSFTKSAETQHMQFLSGGQKSLVALALIFAIQRCDPAPFYLFDEIDSALDPEHRAAVANMIKKQSGKAQFITTTFRPELVATAKKHYGITFKNKVSTIKAIKKAKALEIIHAEAEQEQQRGETTLQLPVTPLLLHPPPRDDEPEEEEQVDRTGQ